MQPPNLRSCRDSIDATMMSLQYAYMNLQQCKEFQGTCTCACNNEITNLLSGGLKGIRKLFCCKTQHKEYEGVSPLPGNEDGEVYHGPGKHPSRTLDG